MKRLKYLIILLLALSLIAGCGPSANNPLFKNKTSNSIKPDPYVNNITIGGEPPTADQQNNKITIYPTIVDQDNNVITNLQEGNFSVTIKDENSDTVYQCAIITVTNQEGVPGDNISISIALDKSGSIFSELGDVKEAAKKFIDLTDPADEIGLITFSNSPEVVAPLTTATPINKNLLKNKVDGIKADLLKVLTALYDAVKDSVGQVSKGTNARRAVIALTDGGDTNSSYFTSAKDVANYAKLFNVPVYTIGLGLGSGNPNEEVLKEIASDTGGIYFKAPNSKQLLEIYTKISNTLSSYYSIEIESPIPLTPGHIYIIEVEIENYGEITGSHTFTIQL